MGKRINIDGSGDDPDEYWFECAECKGIGTLRIPDEEHGDEGVTSRAPAPSAMVVAITREMRMTLAEVRPGLGYDDALTVYPAPHNRHRGPS